MNLPATYRRVLGLLRARTGRAVLLVVANVLLAASQFVEPILFGRVIDTLAGAKKVGDDVWSTLSVLLAAWVGFGLFNIVASTCVAYFSDKLSHSQRLTVLADYFEHVLQLPLAYHGDVHSGRLMKVMVQGTDSLAQLWLGFFREHFAAFVSLLVLLPLSLFVNWRLSLLLMGLTVVFAGLTIFVLRKTESLQDETEEHYSELAERASDALGNVALVHSFARVEAEVSDLRKVSDRLLAAQMPVLSWWAVISVLTRASTTITILSIVVTGTFLHLRGLVSIGEIVTFMSFSTMLIDRLQQAIGFVNKIFMEGPRLAEFFEVLDTEPAIRDRANAIDPKRVKGQVRFRDVSFSYDGKRPAIADLDFTAEPGDVIALVGSTGAGKTTALSLLHRAFDPQSGAIEIDGVDIRKLKLSALRRSIGVVFQEGFLFNRSIADNLRVGKASATLAEMRSAAIRAEALDFIERSKGGFDGRVGERGRLLSGGERQRLSIARAFLKDPPILILDEATSALDAATEQKILTALDAVMKDRTTFVIAHRLATVKKATKILVFEDGRVVESGTFEELLEAGGRFAELAAGQSLAPEAAEETSDAAA